MLVSELIRKKRDGFELSADEIAYLVKGASEASIPDYQIAAWLMASYLKGLSGTETVELTRGLKNSGRSFEWRKMSSGLKNARFVDKHSSGGVGDKVSLILAPLAAAMGLTVPMISGRGLGHTGGTVDKLESIPGFNLHLSEKSMIEGLENIGCCMLAQMDDLCPADRKLYHLRDVTGTVESLSLITASIVSKKWAEGVDAIVYDVKCGEGAFMHSIEKARELAKSLVDVSRLAGMSPLACITRMDEPLGSMIGNALEVKESLWILSNDYPSETLRRLSAPLMQLTLDLVAHMAVLSGKEKNFDQAHAQTVQCLESGAALKIFQKMAAHQGAHKGWEDKLPQASHTIPFTSPKAGKLARIHSRRFGLLGIEMGAGRATLDSHIDPAVGIEMHVQPGDTVQSGQPLLSLHLNSQQQAEALLSEISHHFNTVFLFDGTTPPSSLLMERIS